MGNLQGSKFPHARQKAIPVEKIEDERYGALMFWLILLLFLWLINFFDDLLNFSAKMRMLELLSNLGAVFGTGNRLTSPLILPLTILLNATRIISAGSLLFRQKWGLFGILGVYAFAFLLELLFGYFTFFSVLRMAIVPGITFLLARPVWKYLE